MFDAPATDLSAVSDLREWVNEQGWSAWEIMMVCLCVATEAMLECCEPPDTALLEAVH